MAIVQIPRTPGIGELFGQGFGSGFSSGMQNIINMRLQNLQQQEQQKQLQQINATQELKNMQGLQALGFSPNEASNLAGMSSGLLDPTLLSPIVRERAKTSLYDQLLENRRPLEGLSPEPEMAGVSETPSIKPQISSPELVKPTYSATEPEQPIIEPMKDAKQSTAKMAKLRKSLLPRIKSGNVTYLPKMIKKLQKSGWDQSAIEAIVSPKLTENIVRYFLKLSNNNPDKARRLAKKFGYKV